MRKRGFIRFDHLDANGQIDSIAETLRKDGLEISDVAPIARQITGTIDEADLERVQRTLKSFGGRFVSEDDDVTHHLPDPHSKLQND